MVWVLVLWMVPVMAPRGMWVMSGVGVAVHASREACVAEAMRAQGSTVRWSCQEVRP